MSGGPSSENARSPYHRNEFSLRAGLTHIHCRPQMWRRRHKRTRQRLPVRAQIINVMCNKEMLSEDTLVSKRYSTDMTQVTCNNPVHAHRLGCSCWSLAHLAAICHYYGQSAERIYRQALQATGKCHSLHRHCLPLMCRRRDEENSTTAPSLQSTATSRCATGRCATSRCSARLHS